MTQYYGNLSPEQIEILKIKDSYPDTCPNCSHDYVETLDDGKDCFTIGKRYWVHFCEMDDNLHSEEIAFCPYCGYRLPTY